MLALDVLLEVTCCKCIQTLAVTVRCEGDGLMDGNAKTLVHLACPACQQINHAIFAPDTGEVIEVMESLRIFRMPEPSVN